MKKCLSVKPEKKLQPFLVGEKKSLDVCVEHELELKKFNSKEGFLTPLLKVPVFKLSLTISNILKISKTDEIFLTLQYYH